MKTSRIFGAALAALLTTSALAQVNVVPQVGVNTANIRQPTYVATILSLVPVAAATDMFCISGSASKNIYLRRVALSGTAGTLVTTPVVLLRRTSLDTGTGATSTYVSAATPLSTNNAAATATIVAYNSTGGNPTIVDSSPTYLRAGTLTLNVSGTTAAPADRLIWEFGGSIDPYEQAVFIPAGSIAQQVCVNLVGVSINAGVLQGSMEWQEY